MKKIFVFLLLLLFAFGCGSGSDKEIDELKKEIERLKIMIMTGQAAATDRIWPFYGLSSGTNALNGIGVDDIGDNDMALGSDSNGYVYVYYWNQSFSNGGTCTSPSCILPSDLTSEDGAWETTSQSRDRHSCLWFHVWRDL